MTGTQLELTTTAAWMPAEESRDVVSQQPMYPPVAALVRMGRLRSWSQYPAQKLDVLPIISALAEAAMASRKSVPCRNTPSMRWTSSTVSLTFQSYEEEQQST